MTAMRVVGLVLILLGIAIASAGLLLIDRSDTIPWQAAISVIVIMPVVVVILVLVGISLWLAGVVPRRQDTRPDRTTDTRAAEQSHDDGRRPERKRVAALLVLGLAMLSILGTTIWGVQWLDRRLHPDPSHLTAALEAADRGDIGAFRAFFDRLPAGTDAAGFAQALRSRYGRFRRAQQVTGWSEPTTRHIETARFRLEYDRATLDADVTIRILVDEASATGNLGYLGQTRIVRILIRDPSAGDLTIP